MTAGCGEWLERRLAADAVAPALAQLFDLGGSPAMIVYPAVESCGMQFLDGDDARSVTLTRIDGARVLAAMCVSRKKTARFDAFDDFFYRMNDAW